MRRLDISYYTILAVKKRRSEKEKKRSKSERVNTQTFARQKNENDSSSPWLEDWMGLTIQSSKQKNPKKLNKTKQKT